MKKCLAAITGIILIALIVTTHGCKKSNIPGGSGSTASAEKTSFNEVASRLDSGGSLYLYLSTEQLLNGLSTKVGNWRQLIDSIPDEENRDKAGKALNLATNLIQTSGLEDVSGFGMSSIAIEPGVYRSKAFLHHYRGKGNGFLWKIGGDHPHPLTGLDLLPANTAFASFSDADIKLVWSVIQQQVKQSDFPEAHEFLGNLPAEFQRKTGLNWDKVINSLGGEMGLVLTLDESRMIAVPIPTPDPLQVPEPAIAVVIKVNDDTLFNRIDEGLKETGQRVISTNKGDLKMRTVPVPLPLPIQLRPTVAAGSGYLVIASTDAMVQEIFAVKSGAKPGLKSTEEFKHLAQGIADQGNQFTYLSKRFGQTILEIEKQALHLAAEKDGKPKPILQSLLNAKQATFFYTVSANMDEGWLVTGNGNQHPVKMLAAGAMVPLGMIAGMSVPAFVKARSTSQKNACIHNLRQIDGAKAQWALERQKSSSATPSETDLKEYLHADFPSCPQGGHYTIGRVSNRPECSIPGHELP